MKQQLTVEIVNSILEGEDSDRSVRLSENGEWVEVITGGFYDEETPNGEKPGDIVATLRVYSHEYGLHQALFSALEVATGFWPITQYVDHELSRKQDCIIGGAHWPGLVLNDNALARVGYEISEYPWVRLIPNAQSPTEGGTSDVGAKRESVAQDDQQSARQGSQGETVGEQDNEPSAPSHTGDPS